MDFFISDLCLGHGNIIRYDRRPFNSIEDHDETIIKNWNSVVSDKDTTYLLGNIAFGLRDEVAEKINKLNGRICLIRGNHDVKQVERAGLRDRFQWIRDLWFYKATIEDEPIRIVLCHYPMLRWDRSHYGVWHLYGHCRGKAPERSSKDLAIDVGCNLHNYTPLDLYEVIWMFRQLEDKGYGPQRINK